MFYFALNLLITGAWLGLSQNFGPLNLLIGFFSGYFILLLLFINAEDKRYFKKIPTLFFFVIFYVKELLLSNIRVAWDVLTPKDLSKPAIIGIPIALKSDFQVALLMNLITFTPGSLSVDLSEDKKMLYVHGMFVHDREQFITEIKNGFERRIVELFE